MKLTFLILLLFCSYVVKGQLVSFVLRNDTLFSLDQTTKALTPITKQTVSWGAVQGKPSGYNPSAHGHAINEVTGLQFAIDGKANSSHAHVINDVTGLQTALNNKSTIHFGLDAGANDSYVVTLSPAPAAYTTGMIVIFRANTANTTGCTINVNGLGVVNIVKRVSTTLATGDILAQMFCMLVYNGSAFVILNPVVN